MGKDPLVSVVMGVYNGAEHLGRALESILSQEGVPLELVVIDDGSADGTPKILNEVAHRDTRLRIFRQENQGLTKALMRGCAQAIGEYIARQDCGDRSLPGRLARQAELLKQNPAAVVCSCGTRFVNPEGLTLYEAGQSTADLNRGLAANDLDDFHGPSHHGAVMFRRLSYRTCGGYRPQFYFAQDLDLWKRMIQLGPAVATEWIGYQAVYSPSSLSARYASRQRRLRQIIFDLSRTSDADKQAELLELAGNIRPGSANRRSEWRGNYFLGACLQKSNPDHARAYLRKVVRENPLHLKAWLKLLNLHPKF